MKYGKNVKDLIGQVFGYLTVIGFSHSKGNAYWYCECKCGNKLIAKSQSLKTGHITSCGCKRKYDNKTHGESGRNRSRIYIIWGNIKQRCYNPKNTSYKSYGGRGIKLCQEWYDYSNFKKWAIENGYAENLEIDRIDNNGNYEPVNCRWITRQIQMRNIRTNNNITMNGVTKPISEWCQLYNITQETIRKRLLKGWGTEKAIVEPTDKYNHRSKKRVIS